MAGMPILHETDVDANMDAHKLVVMAAMLTRKWTQRVIDWDKKDCRAKSGTLLDTQKVYEGRLTELANIENLEVAEPFQLQEVRVQSLEIVYGKWLDDPDAVKSRLVTTQANTHAREDVTQATPPIKASRIIVIQAPMKTNAKGQHDPPKGFAPPKNQLECAKAWHGTRVASKCWGNEVANTLIKEGCKTSANDVRLGEPWVRDGVSRRRFCLMWFCSSLG